MCLKVIVRVVLCGRLAVKTFIKFVWLLLAETLSSIFTIANNLNGAEMRINLLDAALKGFLFADK